MKPSATATANAVGPSQAISSSQESNGPKQNYWRQLHQIQLAYPRASAAAHKERNRPLQSHWQLLQQIQWAHAMTLTAAPRKVMGPSEAIGSLPQLKMQWAHAIALSAPALKVLGPSGTIGSISLDYDSRPTHNTRPLSLGWPMWAFLSSSVKLHMGFTDYYNKV